MFNEFFSHARFVVFSFRDTLICALQVTGANKGIGFAIVRGLCKQFKGDVYLTGKFQISDIYFNSEICLYCMCR